MSRQETPRGDHKDKLTESSLPKKSTIRNIFKNFPTPLKAIKGSHQTHGDRGHEEEGAGRHESLPREGELYAGLLDSKQGHDITSAMPNQEERIEEESGREKPSTSQKYIDSNLKMLSQEGVRGGGSSASQHNAKTNSELSNQGEEMASQHTCETNLNLLTQEEGGIARQENIENTKLLNQEGEEISKTNLRLPRLEEEGGEREEGTATGEHKEKTELVPKSDKKLDDNPEIDETQGNEKPVTHSFSFLLSDTTKEKSQPDSSESLSLSMQPTQVTPKAKTRTKKKGLASTKDGKDSDSSVCSRKKSSKSKMKIKSKFAPGSLEYIEERLCGRIFSGWVEERQWVESVGGYRDVIEVDEWEVEMNQQLQAIISSIPGVKDGTRWINITPPKKDPYYCLWVLLHAPPTPGHYWFTVTATKLQPQFGLMISVKVIRSIHPHDGELAEARRKRLKRKAEGVPQTELESVGEVLQDWLDHFRGLRPSTVLSSITSALTLSNIKETIRFITVLLMTLVIGLVTFVRESHVVGLRFVREAGIFFHNATPFLQTLLGFFEKIIGGLYLLVAMVYKDIRRPSVPPPRFPPPPPPPALTPSPPRPTTGPRAIQYVSPERWVVRTQNNEFT